MKIGIIQSVIGSVGGNDMVLKSLLTKLKETDHEVTIYTIGTPRMDLSVFNIKKIKKLIPIKIPLFGVYQKMLEPMLAKKAQHEDLLISLTGDLFLPAKKKQRLIFYSQNNYGDPTKTSTSKYDSGLWKYYYMPYKKMMIKFKKNIKNYNIEFVANSSYVREQLRKALGHDSLVIYPPVHLSEFTNDEENKQGLITVSRYSKEKNLAKIVDLMGKTNEPCKIFGNISEVNRPYMNDIIKKGKAVNIKFYINQDRELMKRLLAKSKIFISASDETFGIAVIEAISSGCIPLVPDSSAHRETVPYNELRYTNDGNEKLEMIIKHGFPKIKELQEHIKMYDESVFQQKFLELIEK